MSAPSSAPASEAEVLRVYDEKRGKVRMLIGKIGELENELSEHKRVGDMLAPMDGARRAFQLVNGVLVESTVADVRPVVGQNQAGLREVLEKLGDGSGNPRGRRRLRRGDGGHGLRIPSG